MKEYYTRKGVYKIEEVLPFVVFKPKKCKDPDTHKDYDGDLVNMTSDRYKTFKLNGTKCVKCGLEGKYFGKEYHNKTKKIKCHFNLYAIDSNGEEVLMTKDHIIPKARGGMDHLDNYQTMCHVCNEEKGSRTED